MDWQKTGTIAAASSLFVLELMSPKHGCSLTVLPALGLENRLISTPKSYACILTRSSLRVTACWLGHPPKKGDSCFYNLNQRAGYIFPYPEEAQAFFSAFSKQFPCHQPMAQLGEQFLGVYGCQKCKYAGAKCLKSADLNLAKRSLVIVRRTRNLGHYSALFHKTHTCN